MFGDELPHHPDAALVLKNFNANAAGLQQLFLPQKRLVLADHDMWNPIQDDGTAAHRAGG